MSLGERIKEQRKKTGLSQERVAELVGVSRQSVAKWKSGQSAPIAVHTDSQMPRVETVTNLCVKNFFITRKKHHSETS